MFSPISAATEQLSMDMYTRKNDHAQSVVGPHLAVVLTSVVHTPGFTETEMSFIPCPFKSVTKFSTDQAHGSGCKRGPIYSAAVCFETLSTIQTFGV